MSFDLAALNFVDYLIIATLVVSGIMSTLRGMTRETLGLLGWPIAIIAARFAAPLIEPTISDVIRIDGIGQALGWALPFATTVVLWFMLANRMSPGLKRAGFGILDRWLGFLFGLIRGYVIALLIYAGAAWVMDGDRNLPKQVESSVLSPYVKAGVVSMADVLPEDMRDRIRDNLSDKQDLGDVVTDVMDPVKDALEDTSDNVSNQFDLLKDETKSQ